MRALESASTSDVTGSLGWVLGELVRVGQVGFLNRSLLEDEHDGGSAGVAIRGWKETRCEV